MKSVKQQYIDLKEGKMTQAQFMRNIRMSLPQYVTNVTSFNDTVKILKNKAILTEADIKENENPYFSSDPTDGDRDFDMKSMVQAEEYYDKGLQAYSEGDLLKAEQYYNAALKAGAWLGWTEFDLPPYESLKEADIYGIAGDPEAETERRAASMSIKPAQTPEEKYGVNKRIDQYELDFLKKLYAKNPTEELKQAIDDLENKMSLNEAYDDPQSAYILNGIKGETKDAIKKVVGVDNSGHYSKDVNWFSENGYTKMTFDTIDDLFAAVPNIGRVFSGGSVENQKNAARMYKDHMGTNPFVVWVKRNSLRESYTTNTSGKELYSKFAEIDNLNGQEVLIGIDYEIEKNSDLTKKEATKIVIKNLKKNPFYYTDSLISGKEGAKAEYMNKVKPGSDQMKDVKSNDLVDKTNGMTSPKGIEKAKASANKAHKETNKVESGIKMMSLVAKTVRGVKKMDATGEKMKKLALKEAKIQPAQNYDVKALTKKIIDELEGRDSYDSNEVLELIKLYQEKYNFTDAVAKEIDKNIFIYKADERYDDGSELDEYSTMPGGDNMTDVAGHQMDEAKVSSLSVGDKFKMNANLGKFVRDEEVEVISLEPFGNDIRLVLSNGKDEDDFYL